MIPCFRFHTDQGWIMNTISWSINLRILTPQLLTHGAIVTLTKERQMPLLINQWDDDPDILNSINMYELVIECRLYFCYKAILQS